MSKSRVKRLAAQMVETPPEKLVEIIDRQMTELTRLTAALADVRAENERERSGAVKTELRRRIAELESHQRWVAVSDQMPPFKVLGYEYMFVCQEDDYRCVIVTNYVPTSATHWREIGDLPARSEGA